MLLAPFLVRTSRPGTRSDSCPGAFGDLASCASWFQLCPDSLSRPHDLFTSDVRCPHVLPCTCLASFISVVYFSIEFPPGSTLPPPLLSFPKHRYLIVLIASFLALEVLQSSIYVSHACLYLHHNGQFLALCWRCSETRIAAFATLQLGDRNLDHYNSHAIPPFIFL